MQQFDVDDELAALIERLAKPKPFENLSFNDALWRVIRAHIATSTTDDTVDPLDKLMEGVRADLSNSAKKAPSPSVTEWVASVPDLKNRKGLTSWKTVCVLLKIETAGDSARRKLKNWVKANRPGWPPVPDID
jgi:hypothetical protein